MVDLTSCHNIAIASIVLESYVRIRGGYVEGTGGFKCCGGGRFFLNRVSLLGTRFSLIG
jgi:hypothetical protein